MKKKLVLLLSKPGLLFLLLNVWIIKGDQISWGKLEKHYFTQMQRQMKKT